jgi:hypothetical protein
MRYNKFSYGSQKYGVSSPDTLLWGLSIDWDDDGIFGGVNEATWLKHVSIRRGRNNLISANGNGFDPIQPGTLEVTLDNLSRRYDPYNEASPLYPNIDTGRFIKLVVRVGATVYNLFSGTIQNIAPGRDTVQITAEDGLRWLIDQEVISGVYQSITADVAIGAILDQAKWPWGRSLQAGADTLDYWWMRGRNGSEEIRSVAESEFGRAYVDSAGAMVFYNRFANRVPVLSVDQSQILRDVAFPQPWEVRRNIVQVRSHPIAELALDDVWTASTEYAVDAGASIEISVAFETPAINVLQPVATTDYTAFSQSGGAGDDLTANISIEAQVYAETATLTIANSSASLAYLNLLKLRGNPLFSSTVKSQATSADYARRPRLLSLDLEWQQDINNPASFANEMLEFFDGARELPIIQIESRPEIQFAVDLFDAVTLQIPARNLSDTFQVGAIQHEWLVENGQAVRTTWKMEPIKEYTGWRFGQQFPITFA